MSIYGLGLLRHVSCGYFPDLNLSKSHYLGTCNSSSKNCSKKRSRNNSKLTMPDPSRSNRWTDSHKTFKNGYHPLDALKRYYTSLDPTSGAYVPKLDPRNRDYDLKLDIFHPHCAVYNPEFGGTSDGQLTKALKSQLSLYAGPGGQELLDQLKIKQGRLRDQEFKKSERRAPRSRKVEKREEFQPPKENLEQKRLKNENKRLKEELAAERQKRSQGSDQPSEELHQHKKARYMLDDQLINFLSPLPDFTLANNSPFWSDPAATNTQTMISNSVSPEALMIPNGFGALDDELGFPNGFNFTSLFPQVSDTAPHLPEKPDQIKTSIPPLKELAGARESAPHKSVPQGSEQKSGVSSAEQWADIVKNARGGTSRGVSGGTTSSRFSGVSAPAMRQIQAENMDPSIQNSEVSSRPVRESSPIIECVHSHLWTDEVLRSPASFMKSIKALLPCVQSHQFVTTKSVTKLQKDQEDTKHENSISAASSPAPQSSLLSPIRMMMLWRKRDDSSSQSIFKTPFRFSARSMLSTLGLRGFKIAMFWEPPPPPKDLDVNDPRFGWVNITRPIPRPQYG